MNEIDGNQNENFNINVVHNEIIIFGLALNGKFHYSIFNANSTVCHICRFILKIIINS